MEKRIKFLLEVAGIAGAITCLGFVSKFYVNDVKPVNERTLRIRKLAVETVENLVSGTDGIIDVKESQEFVTAMGYQGKLYPEETVFLKKSLKDDAKIELRVGPYKEKFRTLMELDINSLNSYIKMRQKK